MITALSHHANAALITSFAEADRRRLIGLGVDAFGDGTRHLAKRLRHAALGVGDDAGLPAVDLFADRAVQGELTQQFRLITFGDSLAAATAEDGSWWPHCEQTCRLMFSTTPSTGTLTLRNISMPFLASSSAMSCGVVTITAPLTGTFCASVNCTSPVPGGMSMKR